MVRVEAAPPGRGRILGFERRIVMAERTERAVLNELIETCRDGARGFQDAADLVNDASLKTLLASMSAR